MFSSHPIFLSLSSFFLSYFSCSLFFFPFVSFPPFIPSPPYFSSLSPTVCKRSLYFYLFRFRPEGEIRVSWQVWACGSEAFWDLRSCYWGYSFRAHMRMGEYHRNPGEHFNITSSWNIKSIICRLLTPYGAISEGTSQMHERQQRERMMVGVHCTDLLKLTCVLLKYLIIQMKPILQRRWVKCIKVTLKYISGTEKGSIPHIIQSIYSSSSRRKSWLKP